MDERACQFIEFGGECLTPVKHLYSEYVPWPRNFPAVYYEGSNVCLVAKAVGGVQLVEFGDIAPAYIDLCGNLRSAGRAHIKMIEPYLGAQIAKQFAATFGEVVERVRA